jgi:hypothetical protein
VAVFDGQTRYTSYEKWAADVQRHTVPPGSPYGWQPGEGNARDTHHDAPTTCCQQQLCHAHIRPAHSFLQGCFTTPQHTNAYTRACGPTQASRASCGAGMLGAYMLWSLLCRCQHQCGACLDHCSRQQQRQTGSKQAERHASCLSASHHTLVSSRQAERHASCLSASHHTLVSRDAAMQHSQTTTGAPQSCCMHSWQLDYTYSVSQGQL